MLPTGALATALSEAGPQGFGADLVGGYGLSVVWNDTHGTGIYSWETLRAWCHCPVCASGE